MGESSNPRFGGDQGEVGLEEIGRNWGQCGGLSKSARLAATLRVIEEMFSAFVTMQRVEEIVGCVVVEAAEYILRNGLAHELAGRGQPSGRLRTSPVA